MRRRKPKQKKGSEARRTRSPRFLIAGAFVSIVSLALLGGAFLRRSKTDDARYIPRPRGEVVFTKDIAPIIYENCAPCHRPGQSAPFSLLTYKDAKKHASDIADATARRLMPPWLPEPGVVEFVGERRLSADQIGLIQQWVAEGTIEGDVSHLPPAPQWKSDWHLGEPDLIVAMPEVYELLAEGRDVYRNFVVPVPVKQARFVRALELRPGNPRVVHHAFVKLDRTPQSRRQDERDPGPGFGGMNVAAEMPGGHFLGWQPGRMPSVMPEGLAWRIDPGNDLVLQLHLNPSGKAEPLQCSVGLYFTDRPPTNTCFKMFLTSHAMEIPAGAREYVVQDSFVLPADVQALAVFPHAHYLAKEMRGWATRPDGTQHPLLSIKEWDFNWQGDYRYARPIFLPRGTTLSMRFTYDNSTNNARNPNHPPKPVTYGPQSSDEMAELALQLLPLNASDYDALAQATQAKMTRAFIEADEQKLRRNPNDAEAHAELGLLFIGQNRLSDAERHLRAALALKPELADAHYNAGLLFRRQNKLAEAKAEFETTLRLDTNSFKAHGNLGFIFLEEADLGSARLHFEKALQLNPEEALLRSGLEQTLKAAGGPR